MKILQIASRAVSRVTYESVRYIQKSSYYIRKCFHMDILKQYEQKLFGFCYSREQVLDKLSEAVLSRDYHQMLSSGDIPEDCRNQIVNTADACLAGKWYVLFHYREYDVDFTHPHVDWYTDYATHYKYRNSHTYDCRKNNSKQGVDIKNIWELSRLQFLIAPALAWSITDNPAYALFVKNVLLDWIQENKYEEGPNWNVSMEVGIRAYNMTLAFELITTCKDITADELKTISASLFLHMRYIMKNQENYRHLTYNHYLGDLIGTLAVGALFKKNSFAKRIFQYSRDEFEKEIQRQILADGGSFEGTSCYHGLVGEIFSLAALLVKNSGECMSQAYHDRLYAALRFSRALSANGQMVQIGDNDSGRVLCIVPGKPLDYSTFHNLSSCVLGEGIVNRNATVNILPVCGYDALKMQKRTDIHRLDTEVIIFPESQIACQKNKIWDVILSATEAQKYGLGGHTHNDKSAVIIKCLGKELITDPGSGCYTSSPIINTTLRSVKSHSTVSVMDFEQNKTQAEKVFGNSYEAHSIVYQKEDSVCAETNVKHPCGSGYRHLRKVSFRDQTEVNIIDRIITSANSEIISRYILCPDFVCNLVGEHVVILKADITVRIQSESRISVVEGLYSPLYGEWQKTCVLCVHKVSDMFGACEIKTNFILEGENKND